MVEELKRIIRDPHRIYFLAAGFYAIFSLLVWEIWLGVHAAGGMMTDLPFAAAPHEWHAHELIFGYASAAIGGFLLTAVPNWTGGAVVARAWIPLTAFVWLAGRVAVWSSGALPAGVVAAIDLAFLPLLAAKTALMLWRRPKPQNVVFLVFLTLLWTGNLLVHLEWMGLTDDTLATGMRGGLFALCVMIAVLGGRVTPGFTRNAMKREEVGESHWPRSRRVVDIATVGLTFLVVLLTLTGAPEVLSGGAACAAGGFQIIRSLGWAPIWTLRRPIIWALHLSMAMLGIGLLLWGLSQLGIGSEVAGLHVLGIGAIGGMTLAVMSRAVLGHSGRELVAPGAVAVAYGLVGLAAVLRWLASSLSGEAYFPAILLTGALWILAYVLYLIALWPAFTGPHLQRNT